MPQGKAVLVSGNRLGAAEACFGIFALRRGEDCEPQNERKDSLDFGPLRRAYTLSGLLRPLPEIVDEMNALLKPSPLTLTIEHLYYSYVQTISVRSSRGLISSRYEKQPSKLSRKLTKVRESMSNLHENAGQDLARDMDHSWALRDINIVLKATSL